MFGMLGGWLSNPRQTLFLLLLRLPAILLALSFHEWGHAYAAYRLGDPTARNMGRMSLNPLHHIDPIGFLMLALVGFGWARPVMINPRNLKNYRRDDIIVSLAGITMNLLLAFAGMLFVYIYLVVSGENANNYIFLALFSIVTINLGLMIFNLIPIPPLDGSHVLESLLIRRTGPGFFVFLDRYGSLILLALLLTGVASSILGGAVSYILTAMQSLFNAIFHVSFGFI